MDLSPENILVTFQCTKKVKLKFYRPLTEEKNKSFFSQKPHKIPTKNNSPRDKKKFQKPCKILTKKKNGRKRNTENLNPLYTR